MQSKNKQCPNYIVSIFCQSVGFILTNLVQILITSVMISIVWIFAKYICQIQMSFWNLCIIYRMHAFKIYIYSFFIKREVLFVTFKNTFSTSHGKIKQQRFSFKIKGANIVSSNGMWYNQQA